ncbi:MAG: hypothetical protein ACKVKR_16400 [Pseudomonadales bacterium]
MVTLFLQAERVARQGYSVAPGTNQRNDGMTTVRLRWKVFIA